MKAIRVEEFGGPEVMKIQECPEIHPGSGQVVVRVKAAGVNPVDTYIRAGQYGKLPQLPYTPGFDCGGIVESVGDDVPHVSPGDRVYTAGTVSGSYAETVLCDTSQVHALPETVSFAQSAAVGVPYGIAYRALFMRARVSPAETVLIHGATGGVGLAAIQLARAAGLTVIGTGGTEQGRATASLQGAHHVLNHKQAGYLQEVMELTHGRGVDVILEMLANINLAKDLQVLAPGGRVLVIGSRGTVEIDPRDTMIREASILGVLLFNATESELTRIHAALGAGLVNGTLVPVVEREMALHDAPKAHTLLQNSRSGGKIVLMPQ